MKHLILLLALILLPAAGVAQSGTTGSLTWTLSNGTLTISGTGAMPYYGSSGSPWYSYRENIRAVMIENGVTNIGQYAFQNCSSLTSVTIPNLVTTIGDMAFDGCSSLTSVTIPNSVTLIRDYAFRDCSSLTSVTIPNSVTTIGRFAFSGCSGMTSVTIANGVTSIGEFAFARCTGLKEVIVRWHTPLAISATVFNAIDLEALTLKVPDGTVAAYQSANVWNNFGRILTGSTPDPDPDPDPNPDPDPDPDPGPGGGNEADFVINANGVLTGYKCTGANAVIPSSVKSIGVGAFQNCTTLTSVTIPQSVTSIGALAFAGCTGLKEVVVAWDTPPSITSLVFNGVSLGGVTLRVPSGRDSAYRSAAVWRLFGTVATGNDAVPEQSVGVHCAAGVLSVDSPAAEQVTVYSAGGALLFRSGKPSGQATFALPRLPRGVAIVAGSSGWTKKIYID
jgi:hypothetical protein